MLFAIHCLDAPDALDRRLAHYEAHKAYLAAASAIKTVVSGPLLADDSVTMVGSLFIVEAPTRGDVEDFHRNDPFYTAGVWETVSIRAFLKRVDNRA
jgi:hypothetical protein